MADDGLPPVIYVTRKELLQRRAACEAELAQIRTLRTEREVLDELDQVAFLLGDTASIQERRLWVSCLPADATGRINPEPGTAPGDLLTPCTARYQAAGSKLPQVVTLREQPPRLGLNAAR